MSYSEKPCIVCGDPVNMYRKGNFNYTKVPLCDSRKKPECARKRKTQLQAERREARKRAATPHAFVERTYSPEHNRVRWDSWYQRCGYCDQVREHPSHKAKVKRAGQKHAKGGHAKLASAKHTSSGRAKRASRCGYVLTATRAGRKHYRTSSRCGYVLTATRAGRMHYRTSPTNDSAWTKFKNRAHVFGSISQAAAANGPHKSLICPVRLTRSGKPQL